MWIEINWKVTDPAAVKQVERPRQFARRIAHIPRQKVVRDADALAGARIWYNTRQKEDAK